MAKASTNARYLNAIVGRVRSPQVHMSGKPTYQDLATSAILLDRAIRITIANSFNRIQLV
jgi:hypothetical protein